MVVTGGVPVTGARGVHVTGGATLLGGMKLIGESSRHYEPYNKHHSKLKQ